MTRRKHSVQEKCKAHWAEGRRNHETSIKAGLLSVTLMTISGIWATMALKYKFAVDLFMAPESAVIRVAQALGFKLTEISGKTDAFKAAIENALEYFFQAWWYSCIFWIAVMPLTIGVFYWLKLKDTNRCI